MTEHLSKASGVDEEPSADEEAWLLVAVSTAGAADSLRVHVWRKLHGLGAVYLQQSVCMLPDRPAVAEVLRKLVARIEADGGSARCLHLRIDDKVERRELIDEFRRAVTIEYGEVLERLPTLSAGVETGQSRATLREVEEYAAELARLEFLVTKVRSRDYFHAPAGAEVCAELDRARAAIAHAKSLF
ncbi:Chromate resistance protein ChrB [Streptomyces camponoticapitis]|uniref:Chromate resistance protein ChrB n=1 Tax=Streptomyces camponoticapitis TaxID=1616125 RepID=UPI00166CAF9A|nr:Chromate resistance protein ChrB [Streptomyces camponoticapitis]